MEFEYRTLGVLVEWQDRKADFAVPKPDGSRWQLHDIGVSPAPDSHSPDAIYYTWFRARKATND